MLLWMCCALAQAGSLAEDRLAVYHQAVQTMNEEGRLGVLTAWQGLFTVKVAGLSREVGEASRDALLARGYDVSLDSGSAPYVDGDLKASLYIVSVRAGDDVPIAPALDLQAFAARDIYLEHVVDGEEVRIEGAAASADSLSRLELLLRTSPCFGRVDAQPSHTLAPPLAAFAYALDATPGYAGNLTDCLAHDAIASSDEVAGWMVEAEARGLRIERRAPWGSGGAQVGRLQVVGLPTPLLAWLERVEAPDKETLWIWDRDRKQLRVEIDLFSAAPRDEETALALKDALRAHRRAQRRRQPGAPDLAGAFRDAQAAAEVAEWSSDYALIADSYALLSTRVEASSPPAFTASQPDAARAAVAAQRAAFEEAVAALAIDSTTARIDLSLRVLSMFTEQHHGTIRPEQVVEDRHEGLLRHQHVEVKIDGTRENMEALQAAIRDYASHSSAVLLSQDVLSGEDAEATLSLTVDLWGVDPLPERTEPELLTAPRTRHQMLAVRGRPSGTSRDPFVDPPSFDAARAASGEVPVCARHLLGSYTFVGLEGDAAAFRAGEERCLIKQGERLGLPLEGMEAWFYLVGVDDDGARFELGDADGGPAPIQASVTLEREP